MTMAEFLATMSELYGPEYVEEKKHTILPCFCNKPHCHGWTMDVSRPDEAFRAENRRVFGTATPGGST